MKKGTVAVAMALVLALLGLWGAGGCLMENISGSGELQTESFDFSDFSRLEVHSGFRVELTRADSFSIEITTDDNLQEYVEVEQSDETLSIRLLGNRLYYSATLEASITMPDIDKLELTGGSQASVSGFSFAHQFELEMSGGSQLSGEIISGGDFEMELSGGSQVDLVGAADDLLLDASGGSLLELEDFLVDNASIQLSGGSRATVSVYGTLDANLSGGSKVIYAGAPTLGDIELSGGAEVEAK